MKQGQTVDVVIPSYKPGPELCELVRRLEKQTVPVSHILIINTDEEAFDEALYRGMGRAEVFHIPRKEFDHAGTRNMGADLSDADYLVYLTQDALPADRRLVEFLLKPFGNPKVRASYARQLPKNRCGIPEGLVRRFNYPPESRIRSARDLQDKGIKTFFCSNVCAAYDRRMLRELEGFSAPCIFNEDMVYAGRLIGLGYSVAYAAEARVYHSHNYTNLEQLHRNFDNGVSQALHPEVFKGVPSAGEGKKMIRFVTRGLRDRHRGYMIPGFYLQCAFRLAGFQLGKHFRLLPRPAVMALTMNKPFWEANPALLTHK